MISVQAPNFQKWNDINAFGSGFTGAQDMYAKNVQNEYLQPTLQQELLKAQYNNQLLGAQAQYAQPMAQAGLATAQAQAPLMNAQTADIYQGKIPLQIAQTGLTGVQATNEQNFPLKDELNGSLENALLMASKYGPNSQQAQAAQNIAQIVGNKAQAMAAYYGANTQLKNLPLQVKNQIIAQGYTPGANATQNPVNIFGGQQLAPPGMPNLQNQLNGASNSSQQPFIAAQIQGQGNNPAVQNQIALQNTPEMKDVAQSSIIKGTQTTAQQNQRLYANTFNSLAQQAAPMIPVISQYAGLAGQTGKTLDQYMASLGTTNPDYQKYIQFTQQIAPSMVNEYRRMLGGQATDSEQQLMASVVNPITWKTNPQLAISQFNNLMQLGRNQSQLLSQSPAQLQQQASSDPLIVAGNPPIDGAPANTVTMSYQGKIWHVPKDKVDIMKKNGGQPIG